MNADWKRFLAERGARFVPDESTPAGFADAPADSPARGLVVDLSDTAVLRVAGADASDFLQGQVTCDVREATGDQVRRGALCTPKGRVLATFRLWRTGDGYRMLLPGTLVDPLARRLGLYVLRAKVAIENVSDARVRLGVAGPGAEAALARALERSVGALPGCGHRLECGEFDVLGLPGARYLLEAPFHAARAAWVSLAGELAEQGAPAWAWRALLAGDADVLPATQDQFVPQMLNLDRLGGISFAKGCYTGQEIVTRTQHLGRIKQRLFRCTLPSGPSPAPGTPLFSPDFEGQASGTVLAAAALPDTSVVVLAVLRVDTVEAALAVRVGAPDGAMLVEPRLVEGSPGPQD